MDRRILDLLSSKLEEHRKSQVEVLCESIVRVKLKFCVMVARNPTITTENCAVLSEVSRSHSMK